MKISIFGLGYVGIVSGASLTKLGHEIIVVDTNAGKVALVNKGVSPIVEEGISDLVSEAVGKKLLRASTDAEMAVRETDISFVSVGTPAAANGSFNLDAVMRVTKILRQKDGRHTVVYRSTILPGTTEDKLIPSLIERSKRDLGDGLGVCFNPDFLREGSSIADFDSPPYTIIGSATDEGYRVLEAVHGKLTAPVVRTTLPIAESVKSLVSG